MRRIPLRPVLRRLRPGTVRLRLTLLTMVVAAIPLSAAAAATAVAARSAILQDARQQFDASTVQWRFNGELTHEGHEEYSVRTDWGQIRFRAGPRIGDIRTATGKMPQCTRRPAHPDKAQEVEGPRGGHSDRRFSLCQYSTAEGSPFLRRVKTGYAVSKGTLSLAPWSDPAHTATPLRQEAIYLQSHHREIMVTYGLEAEQAQLNTVVWSLTGGVVGFTLLMAGGTWFTVRRVLRPVEAIRAEFADLTTHHLDRRVPVPEMENEIARLATTMNITLDRLEAAVEQQRRFVADASHELRTPLTSLRTELELALTRSATADWQQVVTDALGDTLRLQHLTTDLLLLARLDTTTGSPPGTQRIDLAELVRDEIARLHPPPHLTLITHIDPQPLVVRGSRPLLGRVLGNLLDNAGRHAASTITIHLTHAPPHTVTLSVLDDGPGIPLADHVRIFERFTRLDNARARDTGGAGLGLAIAHRITVIHQGTLILNPTSDGAHFIVSLPADRPPQRASVKRAGVSDQGRIS